MSCKTFLLTTVAISALAFCLRGATAADNRNLLATHASGTVHRAISAMPAAVTLYDQNNDDNGIAIISSRDDDVFTSYSSYGADDFSVPNGHKWRVTQVRGERRLPKR